MKLWTALPVRSPHALGKQRSLGGEHGGHDAGLSVSVSVSVSLSLSLSLFLSLRLEGGESKRV